MTWLTLLSLWFLFPSRSCAQVRLDSLLSSGPVLTIQHLPPDVEAMEVDAEGNIYLVSPSKHRIHKLLRNTRYDSTQTVGGKGIGREGFNRPSRIVAPNRQTVYVLDEMNRRIAQLSPNLKVLTDINFLTLEEENADAEGGELWPLAFAVGPTGEMYLLNQDNFKVYKVGLSGKIELVFGGVDYGAGSLRYPCQIDVNDDNFVFVFSCEDQYIYIYDLYGVFQYRIRPQTGFDWTQGKSYSQNLMLFDQEHLYVYNLLTKGGGKSAMIPEGKLQDVAMNQEFLFLLFENRINLYRLKP